MIVGSLIVAALFSKSASISVAIAVAVAAAGKGRSIAAVMRDALLKPIVIAPVMGLTCSLAGFSRPPLVESSLKLVG